MSHFYASLLEKIEKQNTEALRDKLETERLLDVISGKIHGQLSKMIKYLKVIVILQLASLGASYAPVRELLKVLL